MLACYWSHHFQPKCEGVSALIYLVWVQLINVPVISNKDWFIFVLIYGCLLRQVFSESLYDRIGVCFICSTIVRFGRWKWTEEIGIIRIWLLMEIHVHRPLLILIKSYLNTYLLPLCLYSHLAHAGYVSNDYIMSIKIASVGETCIW